MAEWLANLTAFRDVLLLLVNLGVLAGLIVIICLLVIHLRRTRVAQARQAELFGHVLSAAPGSPLGDFKNARSAAARPATIAPEVLASLNQLLTENCAALQKLDTSLAREPGPGAGDELRQLVEEHRNSIRQLLADWGEESARRLSANEQLRDLIREDLRAQAERLRQVAERPDGESRPAPSPTAGTVTASAVDPDDGWRDELRAELDLIVDKLERMSERMDEIFRI